MPYPQRLEDSRKGQRMTWGSHLNQFADMFSDRLNPLLVKEVRQAHAAGSGGLDRSASQLGDHQTQRPGCLAARFGSPFQKANPGLRPERSRGIDAGIDRFFDGGRAVASVTVFENRLTDLIGFESADYPELGRSINIARARTRGVEASARAERGAFDGRLSYTFTDAIDLDAPSAEEERLIRRPRHAVAADLGFRHQALTAGLGMFGALGREDSDFNVFPFRRVNPGDYLDARVYGGWRFGSGLVVEARLENVFGSRYEEAYGFPALGRRVTIGFGINR